MDLESLFTHDDEEELLYDSVVVEEQSIDGITRVEELEGLLSIVLDYWDEGVLLADVDQVAEVAQLMDRIGAVLANDSEEYPG